MRRHVTPILLSSLLVLTPSLALAGPPLLCFPMVTSAAPSLPWGTGSSNSLDPDYKVSGLAEDTVALLGPSVPTLARMETLRRAALYAAKDPAAAIDSSRRSDGACRRGAPRPPTRSRASTSGTPWRRSVRRSAQIGGRGRRFPRRTDTAPQAGARRARRRRGDGVRRSAHDHGRSVPRCCRGARAQGDRRGEAGVRPRADDCGAPAALGRAPVVKEGGP